jgi:hypothetical protein
MHNLYAGIVSKWKKDYLKGQYGQLKHFFKEFAYAKRQLRKERSQKRQ